MPFLCRGKINNLLELFHTLPLSLGIAEPCKDAPAVPQHPPPVALPTSHHAGHALPVASVPCQAATAVLSVGHPQNSTKPLQDPEERSCPISRWAAGRNRKFCRDTPGTSPLTACKWAWLEGIPPGFGPCSLCITFFSL